jgi:hypothetical protein
MRLPFLTRRFVAALSSALLLQFSLLGSGTLCAMRAVHGMDAMAMTGSMDGIAPSARDARGEPSPCETPWSAGSCVSMAGCTTAEAVPSVACVDALPRVSVRRVAEPLRTPIGPSFAPEIPPPRA